MLSVVVTGTTDPTRRVLHAAGDLPVEVLSIHDELNKVGGGTANIAITVSSKHARRVRDARETWRRLWWVLDNDRPIFAGFADEHPYAPDTANTLTTTLTRADAILRERLCWSTLPFEQVDQGHIVADLLRYATGQPVQHVLPNYLGAVRPLLGAFLPWLRITERTTGVLRDRLDNPDGFQGATGKPISECINALIGVDDVKDGARSRLGIGDAFDYRLDYGVDDDGLFYAEPVIGYPRLGADRPLEFSYPGPISGYFEGIDSTRTKNGWRTASSDAPGLVGEPQFDADSFAAGWPLLAGQDTSSSILEPTLTAHAAERVQRQKGDGQGWRYTLRPSEFGRYDLGDTLLPTIEHPRRFPGIMYPDAKRVVGHDLTFAGGHLIRLAPILGDLR